MAKKPMVRIYTSASEYIDREMNDEELAQLEKDQIAHDAYKAELKRKADQRQAILDRLGLTADEAKLLLG